MTRNIFRKFLKSLSFASPELALSSREETLRRERDDAASLFSSVFAMSDVGILVTDHHARVLQVNEAFSRTYGWQPIDLVGRAFTVMIPPEDHGAAMRRHTNALEGRTTAKSQEVRLYRKDGTLADVIVSSGVIELSGGRRFRVSNIVDITYLKTVEEALRRSKEEADAASKAKSAFLANMSHELRTPLNAIIGFSDLMMAGTLGPIENKNYIEYLGDIKFSALHLLEIINDVLDMSKIEAGQMKLDPQRTEVAHMLEEAVRLMHAPATEAGVCLATDIAAALPAVMIDRRVMRQVLLNLISNAIKFSGGCGRILLRADMTDDSTLRVSVTDQGIGIPCDKLDEVMRPFGQVQDSRVNAGQGTGLGLPLSRSMVEMHGGTFKIESTPDVGTTVIFTLPVR